MHPKIGLKVIMMCRQGLTVSEIVDRTNLKRDEIINYLIDHGEPVTYNQRQKRRENKITEIRAAMDSMRVLGKPLNCKEVKMETSKTGRGIALSDDIKAKVLELHEAGMSQAKIAEELSIGRSSVYRMIKAAKQPTPEDLQDITPVEEKEPAPVAAETSSEPDWETLTVETAETPLAPITNYTADREFCQALLDDIDTAIKMLMECVFGGESIYSPEKTAFDIGGAVRKLQDAYNKLEEVIYENN